MSQHEAKPEQAEPTEQQTLILDRLGDLATRHIEASNGRLTLLPPDVSMLTHHMEGQPIQAQIIEAVATRVNPDYPALQQATNEAADRQPHLLPVTRELLKGGNNLLVYTNHGELTDVAFAFAAFCNYAAHRGYEDIYNQYRRGIIVSQIVSRVGINGPPGEQPAHAAPMLSYLCHDVWKSYPLTDSMRDTRTHWRDEIKSNNRKVRNGIKERLEEGGYILAMAPSGRQDLPDGNGSVRLHDIAAPTVEMITAPRTYALGIAVWLQGARPIVEFTGYQEDHGARAIPERLQTTDDVSMAMANMADTLNDAVPDTNFVYVPRPRDDRSTIRRAIDRARDQY